MGKPSIRVLYIEDNPSDFLLVQRFLTQLTQEEEVFHLERVDRLSKALERLRQGGIDLILADLNLPDVRGLEAVIQLVSQTSTVPILALTNSYAEKLGVEAVKLGAQDYLIKDHLTGRLLRCSLRHALERHKLQRRLRTSQRVLRTLIEANVDAMVVVDREGRVCFANPAACSLLNHKGAELLDKPLGFSLKVGETKELEFPRPDGAIRTVEVRVVQTKWQEEEEDCLLATFRDITKRKEQEEELRKAQAELMEVEKLTLVGQLAAGAAHEVRNPLATLLQGVNYLSKYVKTDEEEADSILKAMLESIQRANSIIKGLSDLSRPSELTLSAEDLNSIIENSLSLVKNYATKHQVEILKDLNPLPPVQVDKTRIEQVFVNLFMNAIQAMPQGGELRVKAYTKKLTEVGPHVGRRKEDRFKLGETAVAIDIKDSGPGIPEEILPKVFNPFFTTRQAYGGTGLGLSVVRNILEMHQGTIEITNRPEGGTRATVMLKVG